VQGLREEGSAADVPDHQAVLAVERTSDGAAGCAELLDQFPLGGQPSARAELALIDPVRDELTQRLIDGGGHSHDSS
jgi:hypothetical protein